MAQDNEEYKLSADGRITLHTILSNAHHFAAIILSHFYDPELLLILFDTKQHIDDIYSRYGQYITSSSSYPLLQSQWKQIHHEKKTFQKMAQHIINDKFWTKVIIHRVNDDKNKSMEGKRVVFNPIHPSHFSEDKYYHMYSETSHVINSTTS